MKEKMAQKCKDCGGRGRWQEQDNIDEESTLSWYYCETCKGTGVRPGTDDGGDFDVAGESYEDND